MEKSNKIFSRLFLTFVYSTVVFISVNTVSFAELHVVAPSGEIVSSFVNALPQFKHTTEPESSINPINNPPTTSFQYPFLSFVDLARVSGLFFDLRFALYRDVLGKLPLRYRKTSIFFPFHYFW